MLSRLESARLRSARLRLRMALRSSSSESQFRRAIVNAIDDLEALPEATPADDGSPSTERAPDSAPAVDSESELGKEFGG